jgi:glyoxylase-like metal-dependent hydrolase (beta-lactamase superfamily II)
MSSQEWKIGDLTITKIEESVNSQGPELWTNALAGASREEMDAIEWLKPVFFSEAGQFSTSCHSFLVQTPDKRIVIDTCVGNDKKRAVAAFNLRDTPYLDRVRDFGWPLDEVDGVVCTHLHVDHVGWNTRLVDGEWVPTFPNAEYFFVRPEYDHWQHYATTPRVPGAYTDWAYDMVDGVAVFEDSIKPIADAGLITFVEQDGTITPEMSLIPTPGHTPGHASVLIESRGESAVVTGDLMHFVCQISRPDWSATLDSDLKKAAETRQAFVERFADTDTLVLGTHFGTPTGGRIVRAGSSYRFVV